MRHLAFLRWLVLAAGALLVLLGVTLCVIATQIVLYGSTVSTQSAQAAVVLGAAAWGNRPSPVYRERLNEAIRLYRQGRVGTLVFTGGTPELGYPSEAAVARDYARQQGVPDTAILVDVKSRSTFENLVQARALIKAAGIHSVLLVSDPLHMKRAMYLAALLGMDAQPAPSDSSRFQSWSSQARFLWRETLSYAEQLLLADAHRESLANVPDGAP